MKGRVPSIAPGSIPIKKENGSASDHAQQKQKHALMKVLQAEAF